MPIYHAKTSTIADGADAAAVHPSDWNSAHAYTLIDGISLTGNTSGGQAFISSGTFYLAGGNNITLSQNANSVTVSQFLPYESSFDNMGGVSLQSVTLNGASISHAVAFYLPTPISVSFLRLPVRMSASSGTAATTAASMSASCQLYSTWNAVVYSLGVGANSKSLQSVASGSNGWTFMNSVSIAANGTQGSYTQAFSANAEGNGTTLTTQYSVSDTNYPFSSTAFSDYNGARYLDINFNNSLDAGAYWLVFGYSSSSTTNSTGMSAATLGNVKYLGHYGASQFNSAIGIMGSTNVSSGGLLGCGSFSTAGGGTTASLPISAISSSASNVRHCFQFLRSA